MTKYDTLRITMIAAS